MRHDVDSRRICALLIFQSTDLYEPLDLMSPWIDMLTAPIDRVAAHVDAQTHRRFLKTHTPLDGLPWDPSVVYITASRDPRDVSLSWDNHFANMNLASFLTARDAAVGLEDIAEMMAERPPARPESLEERFWVWVDDPRPVAEAFSLASTLHHLATFWAVRDLPNIVLVRYEDLRRDLPGQMRTLAERLGIDVPEERWSELVEAATFDRMRERVADIAPETTKDFWHDNDRFFHKGTSGQWREVIDDDGVRRYAARVARTRVARWFVRLGPRARPDLSEALGMPEEDEEEVELSGTASAEESIYISVDELVATGYEMPPDDGPELVA